MNTYRAKENPLVYRDWDYLTFGFFFILELSAIYIFGSGSEIK